MSEPETSMDDEARVLQARLAYINALREVAKLPRTIGFIGCLLGSLVMIYANYKMPGGARSPLGYTGLGIVAVSWLLFAYSIYRRTLYVRTHPFDPKA